MRKTKKKVYELKPYTQYPLNLVNLAYIKCLCDNYNVQINFNLKPEGIQFRISKIDPTTGRLNKSEQHIFKNEEISKKFTTSTLEIIINNLLTNWYPDNILST
jgi:hypothetical protein